MFYSEMSLLLLPFLLLQVSIEIYSWYGSVFNVNLTMMNIFCDVRPPYQSFKPVKWPHQLPKVFINIWFPAPHLTFYREVPFHCGPDQECRGYCSVFQRWCSELPSSEAEPWTPELRLTKGLSVPEAPGWLGCGDGGGERPGWPEQRHAELCLQADWRRGGNSHGSTVNLSSLRILQTDLRLRPLQRRGL